VTPSGIEPVTFRYRVSERLTDYTEFIEAVLGAFANFVTSVLFARNNSTPTGRIWMKFDIRLF
jgi:hypothetical protein